jgi:hypothetical protein
LRHVVLIVLVLLAPSVILGAHADASVQSFSAPRLLPSASGYGEPSIAVAPDGTLYVAAPGSSTATWRSDNGGFSWARVAGTAGASGDSDVAVDADGTVYASDLFNNVPVSVSHDRAASWSVIQPTALGGSIDRQWLAAHGHGNVWSVWRDGSTERVAASHDGGATWSAPSVVSTSVGLQGNVLATSDADLWIPYSWGADVRLAASHDAGLTWTTMHVATSRGGTDLFPAVALDAVGTMWVAWADAGPSGGQSQSIAIARSDDGGVHFTLPAVLSTPGTFALFPWILADAAGHVEVAWYEGVPPTTTGGVWNSGLGPLTKWYLSVAYTSDGAHWTTQRATPNPVHTGPICSSGTGCVPVANPLYGNRILLDFFEMAERPDGNVIIAFPKDTDGTGDSTSLNALVQIGGPNLKA